jgi:hypothetical protein
MKMSDRGHRAAHGCALLLLALAPLADAQEAAWPSVAGSGFFTLPDARTLPRGRVLLGAAVDNRDRDPLGIDLFDLSGTFAVGLAPAVELYGAAVASRVTAMPEVPALPPPPLDLIVARGARAPAPPYYSVLWTVPYVNKRGTARLDDFVPGDALLGAKWRVRDGTGGAPALAVAGEIKLPLTRDPSDLASGSGTGGVDAGVRAIAAWGTRPAVAASVRYTLAGRPARGDREITIDGNGRATAVDRPLDLPDRVDLGVGARYALRPRLAAVVEASASFDVGSRTPIVDATWPLDVIAGFQARAGHALFSAGLRYHAHALPSGARRPSPVAGLVDLTDVADTDLGPFLEAVGAGASAPFLRPRAQRLLALDAPATALPAGARRVPVDYGIRSEHQLGFVFVAAWEF